MSQLYLPFFDAIESCHSIKWHNFNKFINKNFIFTAENNAIYQKITLFFENFIKNNNDQQLLILIGEAKSGKTHLLNFLSHQICNNMVDNIDYIDFADINYNNIKSFFVTNHLYIIENANYINNQELLLHSINFANEIGSKIIITTQSEPNFKLPDLQSRIINAINLRISDLQYQSAQLIFSNEMSFCELRINKLVVDFIANIKKINYQILNDFIKLFKHFYQINSRLPKLQELEIIAKHYL